jgi:hypothetical protein
MARMNIQIKPGKRRRTRRGWSSTTARQEGKNTIWKKTVHTDNGTGMLPPILRLPPISVVSAAMVRPTMALLVQ